jgi:hypothetical protein
MNPALYLLLLFDGDGEGAAAPDIASLSGCVHIGATLNGRVEVVPTLQACSRIQPTLTGNIEVTK